MSNFFNINDGSANKRIFYANGATAFQAWQKPIGVNFVHFFLLGGGGGGGNGVAGGAGTTRRGGGSGGSSSVTTALFPASVIPDTLYINVGLGGAGGGSVQNGALSYVMFYPSTAFTEVNVFLQSGNAAAGGGQTGSAGGAAGSAGTVWTAANCIFDKLGLITVFSGQIGVAGQPTVASANLFISGLTTAGAPGAGTDTSTALNGGSIIGGGEIPNISGGTTTNVDGSSGYMSTIPSVSITTNKQMIFTGGAGGASSNLSKGGDGGNGAYGCGGGGGGAGITSLAGNGGKGGDGLVIITCW